MNVKLIKLTKEYCPQLSEMIEEWRVDQEINHTNHSPWAIFKNDYRDFNYYLDNLEITEPTDGKTTRGFNTVDCNKCRSECPMRDGIL